jgi:uncharacterized repeat protein (TIGR03803 family)
MMSPRLVTTCRLVAVAVVCLVCSVSGWASGPAFQVIHTFGTGGDGVYPYASLISRSGNFYGTTIYGGAFNNGCVFELSPPTSSGAGWTESILHSFGSGTSDGQGPQAALLFDKAGNLYGTTIWGGTGALGTVFELSPPTGSGAWTETILYNFVQVGKNTTGNAPTGISWGPGGVLYGTTRFGGAESYGNVYELHPPASGSTWLYKSLYAFSGTVGGQGPDYAGGLMSDAAGNLYGTTSNGGPYIWGQVFEISPPATPGGNWTETALYNFGQFPEDGQAPEGTLVFDASGNLYGTAVEDGQYGYGTVFELTPPASGSGPWMENILYSFHGGRDGANPQSGVVFDKAGNLYGTTDEGGGSANDGTVFELSPSGDGTWKESVLHSFTGKSDGAQPFAGLVIDHLGNLYGATGAGGTYGVGTVFRIAP